MNNLERISDYLLYEGIPKTPQEIHKYTGIKLEDVYETLQTNKVIFIQIIKDDSLIGWIVSSGY